MTDTDTVQKNVTLVQAAAQFEFYAVNHRDKAAGYRDKIRELSKLAIDADMKAERNEGMAKQCREAAKA